MAARVQPVIVPLLLAAALAPPVAAQAPATKDVDARTSDGRQVLLKGDGTWRYVDAPKAGASASASGSGGVMSQLAVTERQTVSEGCRLQVELHNRFNYEIRSFVPDFRVVRTGGMNYVELNLGFGNLRPGDRQTRAMTVAGLPCTDIERIQVIGGDRCVMDNLTRFVDEKGACLARFEVVPSQLLKFDK